MSNNYFIENCISYIYTESDKNNNYHCDDYTDFNYGNHKIDLARIITQRDPLTRNFKGLVDDLYEKYKWSLCDIDILLHQLYTKFETENDKERCDELQVQIYEIEKLYKQDTYNNYYKKMIPPLLHQKYDYYKQDTKCDKI